MPVPWLTVGSLVLGNLDKIMSIVRPGFTHRKVDAVNAQADILNQQIAELQAASSANLEQIKQLAAQLKDVVAALEQAATFAAAERAASRRFALLAFGLSAVSLVAAVVALLR
jgi:hypothetical protein